MELGACQLVARYIDEIRILVLSIFSFFQQQRAPVVGLVVYLLWVSHWLSPFRVPSFAFSVYSSYFGTIGSTTVRHRVCVIIAMLKWAKSWWDPISKSEMGRSCKISLMRPCQVMLLTQLLIQSLTHTFDCFYYTFSHISTHVRCVFYMLWSYKSLTSLEFHN